MSDFLASSFLWTDFTVGDVLWRAVLLVVIAAIAYGVQHVAVRGVRRALEASEVPNASIFANILRSLIWVMALLSVLKPVFGIDPDGFITTLGVTSIALSLGLQDTISNLVSGLALMVGRVIKPGDEVTVGSITGVVTDVTWRSTSVRTRGGNVEVIPNSVLNTSSLTHVTRWNMTLCDVSFAVASDADLDEVASEALNLALRALGDLVEPSVKPDVVFNGMTAYGTQATVRAHIRDGASLGEARDRVTRALQGRPWIAHVV